MNETVGVIIKDNKFKVVSMKPEKTIMQKMIGIYYYIDNFDYEFFDNHTDNLNVKKFKKILYKLYPKLLDYVLYIENNEEELVKRCETEIKLDIEIFTELQLVLKNKLKAYNILRIRNE